MMNVVIDRELKLHSFVAESDYIRFHGIDNFELKKIISLKLRPKMSLNKNLHLFAYHQVSSRKTFALKLSQGTAPVEST